MKRCLFVLLLLLVAMGLFAEVLITDSFDAATFPPTGWTNTALTGTFVWERSATGIHPVVTPHTGTAFAMYQSYSTSNGQADLATPSFSASATYNYTVSFWMYRDNYAGYLNTADLVNIYTNSSTASTGGTLIGTVNRSTTLAPPVTAPGWYNYTFEFTPVATAGNSFIIFNALSAFGNDMYIDDVVVSRSLANAPPEPAIIGSPANNATDVSLTATLNWSSGGGSPTSYDVYFGTSATPPFIGNQPGTTYTPTLAYSSTYYWKIVPRNAIGPAANCPTWTFATMSDPSIVTFPYNYGFEGTYPPAGWILQTVSGTTGIQQMASMSLPTASPHSGSYLGYYNSYGMQSPSNAWMATPPMNCTGGTTYAYTASFWMYRDASSFFNTATYATEGINVYANTTQSMTGATLLGFVPRDVVFAPVVASAGWYQYTYTIGNGTIGTRYVIFQAVSCFGDNMGIDDISIVRADLTGPPNPAMIVSPANAATLIEPMAPLVWADGGGFPSSYDVYFGTTLPGTPNANVTTTIWTPPTMNWNTSYSWKIVPRNMNGTAANCPTWTFTTRPDPTITASPYAQNFDGVTPPALPLDWYRIASGGSTLTTVTTAPHSTPNCVYMYNAAATDGPYLISPPIGTALPINTMRIKFWAKGSTTYHLNVGIMTNPLDAATFVSTQDVVLTDAWAEYIVGFQTYTGTGHFMAIKHGNAGTYQSIYIDDVMIEVISTNDLAVTSVTGNTTPSVGMLSNYTVNLFNWGTAPQTTYTVKLMSGTTELSSVAGTTIQPGTAATATLPWTPTTQGASTIFGRVVLTGDQNAVNNDSPVLNVSVQAAGTMVVTIGAGDQQAPWPIDFYWHNSLYESIYFQTELNFIGTITGLSFYNNFADDRQNMPTKIWLGTTTQTDLSAGWIPSTNLTSVFDGNVSYPIGQNTVNITFPTPFLYLTGNLVIMYNRPMDTQYYSSVDYFQCQTVGTNRTLNIYSDGTEYDPAAPPAGATLTGQFAKTSFFIIPSGVGHLNGTVTGAGGVPLEGATVHIVNGAQTTTNAVGHYSIQNIVAGDYQVTVTRNGYISQTQNVTIPEDQTITLNFNMVQMTTVVLSGTIVGSDAPTVGLSGATISFTGYEDYEATTDATGHFSIPGVYANQTYDYFASIAGYQGLAGTVNVLNANLDMGNVILSEIAFSPRNVTATANEAQTIATVTWLAPDPNTADVSAGFEGTAFPPAEWSRIVTDNGTPNASGVLPTCCRIGAVTVGADVITPPEGNWQAGFSYSFSHQDEWLITPQFNCPQGAILTFDSNVFLGSVNGDHYYVKASADNGTTWTVLWDATALTGGWNHYATPINVDLAQFTGQQIKVAWHGDDPNTSSDGMWYVWFIDNVSVGNTTQTIRFPESQMVSKSATMTYTRTSDLPAMSASKAGDSISRTLTPAVTNMSATHQNRDADRSLVGYKVWRLPQGQEQNESVWTLLTPTVITALTLDDTGWATLTEGTYKWAVKGIYTNNVASLAIFSNPVVRPLVQIGTLAGTVRNQNNQPIMGATITVGTLTATTAANGSYVLPIPAGSYSVTCTATNYIEQVQNNIVITGGQTTPLNFILAPVDNEDHVVIDMTALKGNYPNPFNPQTTIAYDVKNASLVRLDIYNTKGQLIRTLVNEVKATGHYSVVWNGKDSKGNAVASGVYNYRMQSGDYKSTRRMMLMK